VDGTTEITGMSNNKCVKAGHRFTWNKTKFDAIKCEVGSDADPTNFTICKCDSSTMD